MCSDCEGEAGFYSLHGEGGEAHGSTMEVSFQWVKGQGEGGVVFTASW